MRKGLDTSVLVYMIDNTDAEKHEKALALLEDMLRNPGGYALTAQVIAELLYVVKRKLPDALEDALFLAERLRAKGIILGSYTIEEVLRAARHPQGRFWDALIAYTYLSHGVNVILTENIDDFKGLIKAVNPFKENRQGERSV